MSIKKTKKIYDVKPTYKHKETLKNIVDNRGNVKQAMIKAGYSKNTAKNPKQNLMSSKGFVALLDTIGLDEEEIGTILKRHAKSSDKRASLTALKMILQARGLLKHNITLEKAEAEDYQGL